MRTMSSETRSVGATPKTATLNSRDVQFGMLNTSASSGSHIIEVDHNAHSPTLERPEDSVHFNTGTSSFQSGKAAGSWGNSLESNRPNEKDPAHLTGGYEHHHPCSNNTSTFNYNYYQLSYDGMTGGNKGHNVNTMNLSRSKGVDEEFDMDEDNVSHDSYRLTSSSRDDSLERELDRYDIQDTVLHIDEEKLLQELQGVESGGLEASGEAEKRAYIASYQEGIIRENVERSKLEGMEREVCGVIDMYCQSDRHDDITGVLEEYSPSRNVSDNREVMEENVGDNRRVEEEYISCQNVMGVGGNKGIVEESSLLFEGSRKIVQGYNDPQNGGDITGNSSKPTKEEGGTNFARGMSSNNEILGDSTAVKLERGPECLSDNTDNIKEGSEKSGPEQNEGVLVITDAREVLEPLNTDAIGEYVMLKPDELQKGSEDSKGSEEVSKVTGNESQSKVSLIDDIPYVLHKRHVSSERKSARTLPKPRSRSKTPSPSRQMSVPLTRKQKRAQLEKIKISLTSPVLSPSKSPKSPRSVSPNTKRTFDFVTYSKLPPYDSYSSKDDSVSPSCEEDAILSKLKRKHESEHLKQEKSSSPEQSKPERKTSEEVNADKLESENQTHEPEKLVAVEESEKKEPEVVNVTEEQVKVKSNPHLMTFHTSSDSENDPLERRYLDADPEDDVNQILSECGDESAVVESSSASSMSECVKSSDELDEAQRESIVLMIKEESFHDIGLESEDTAADGTSVVTQQQNDYSMQHSTEDLVVTQQENDYSMEQSREDLVSPVKDVKLVTKDDLLGDDVSDDIVEETPTTTILNQVSPSSSGDFPLPPPPILLENSTMEHSIDEFPSPDIPPPEVPAITLASPGGGSLEEVIGTEQLGIPSIVIRSATPAPSVTSSGDSSEEPLPPPPPPVVKPKTKRKDRLRYKGNLLSSSSSGSDENIPVVPSRTNVVKTEAFISSEEDNETFELEQELREATMYLQNQASARPYSLPISSDVKLPAPPQHDISSETDSDVARPDISDYQDAAHLLEAEMQQTPYRKPLTGAECMPGVPLHDISSESDSDIARPDRSSYQDAAYLLEAEMKASPFRKPLTGAEYMPGIPLHDVSSDSESNGVQDPADLFDVQEILRSQVLANPYSVPRTGLELLPPPQHDISSESESDVLQLDSSELHDATNVLHSQALANPFAVPMSGPAMLLPPPPPLLQSESSSDEAGNEADEEDVPDQSDTFFSDGLDNPLYSMGVHYRNIPESPPLPPQRVESVTNSNPIEAPENNYQVLPGFQSIPDKAEFVGSSSSSSEVGEEIFSPEVEPLHALERLQQPSLLQYSSESEENMEMGEDKGRFSGDQALVLSNPMTGETVMKNPYTEGRDEQR